MLIVHASDLSELQQNEQNNIKLYVKHVYLIPQVSCGPVDNIFLAQVWNIWEINHEVKQVGKKRATLHWQKPD